MARDSSSIPQGSVVRLRRDDGADVTLLRQRPTSSRTADAFVTPKIVLTSADRLTFLQTVAAEGTSFSIVRTTSGVQGYVQAKYLVPVPAPVSSAFHPALSLTDAVACRYYPAGHCSRGFACNFAHASAPSPAKAAGVVTGFKAAAALAAPVDHPLPFHFNVEWVQRWSATDGTSYYNTKNKISHKQRPACFPSHAPLHLRSPIALHSKSILPPPFIHEFPSPPSTPLCFVEPDEPSAVPAPTAPPRHPPSEITFPDFFASLQTYRSLLGGSRSSSAMPLMKRYTGVYISLSLCVCMCVCLCVCVCV